MNDFQQALIEGVYLYNLVASLESQAHHLRAIVKNNIGSGKYQLLKRIEHDKKILRDLYDENMKIILAHYGKALDVEFELLK